MCVVLFVCVFFFFKQKTAYEMRISDWSSDVCSSDLPRHVCADDWGGCLETDCPPGASMLRRIGLIPALPLCPLEETLDARQNRARQFVQIGGKIDNTPEIHFVFQHVTSA